MSRSAGFAGVILAAGESSRMGTDKALLSWPPQVAGQSLAGQPSWRSTFLASAIRSLLLMTDFVVVIAGKNEPSLAPVAYASGAQIASNPDPSLGQFSSLQIGLRYVLNRGRDAAIITLVDRPPASATTVEKLRDTFTSAPQSIWAIVPEFEGKHGHPYVAGRELIEAFLQAAPMASARDIERSHQHHIRYLPVSDSAVVMNINTPEEYAELIKTSQIVGFKIALEI